MGGGGGDGCGGLGWRVCVCVCVCVYVCVWWGLTRKNTPFSNQNTIFPILRMLVDTFSLDVAHFSFLPQKIAVTPGSLSLTFTILWSNSPDDKLMIFFLFFSENRI